MCDGVTNFSLSFTFDFLIFSSRTSNRSNMRKSGSGQLDRSGDNLDTDDLLNDF